MKVSAQACAAAAELAVTRIPPILYEQEDCQAFIEKTVLRAGGVIPDYAGSNDMFRNACIRVVPLKDAPLEPGMVLFIHAFDGGEPDQYKEDGLGNASHVGWYTGGEHKVVHSSASKGQVAASTLANGWTHAGWLKGLGYAGTKPEPKPVNKIGFINLPPDQTVKHRIRPDMKSAWFALIPGGTQVEVVSQSGEWTRVIYGGHDAYVVSKFITMEKPDLIDLPEPVPENNTALASELKDIADRLQAISEKLREIV